MALFTDSTLMMVLCSHVSIFVFPITLGDILKLDSSIQDIHVINSNGRFNESGFCSLFKLAI